MQSHQQYLDSLRQPTEEEIERISRVQEAKEEDIIKKRFSMESPGMNEKERAKAAALIQRNYRGYRTRRQMQGFGLDASSRWVEAVREAQFRNLTAPKPRASLERMGPEGTHDLVVADEQKQFAREKWKKVGTIARKAAGDDSDVGSDDDDDVPEDQREERRKKRAEKRRERQKEAKMMDLQ